MGNHNTPILTEEEPHIFAAWDRERGRAKIEKQMKRKTMFFNFLRWITLVPLTFLGSTLVIYILGYTFIPQLILGESTANTAVPFYINAFVPIVQIEVAHYIAPSHKKAVALLFFSFTAISFLISLLVIIIEASFADNFWTGVGYFFNETWMEFLRPLSAGYAVYWHGYFSRETKDNV